MLAKGQDDFNANNFLNKGQKARIFNSCNQISAQVKRIIIRKK